MSSLLRLPSLERPTLGLSKRFSILSSATASSTHDDLSSSLASLQTLPSLDNIDNDDFLNMFESSSERLVDEELLLKHLSYELSSTPSRSHFAELHGTPTQRYELDPSTMPHPRVRSEKSYNLITSEQTAPLNRSSVSSSAPSTKKSNSSSRLSRRSSRSSVTEDLSSSDRSSKDSEKEKALHERLKRRSREKRVSFGSITNAANGQTVPIPWRDSLEPHQSIARGFSDVWARTASEIPANADSAPLRPSSRGKRLGQAMAGGLASSPPPTPKASNIHKQRRISSSSKSVKSFISGSYASAPMPRLSRVMALPVLDDIDSITFGIMSHLDHINDLQACALASKNFYTTFQKYETVLVDCVLYQQSRAAWELRYSVRHLEKPSPFRLKSIQRDCATVQALEDFIVGRCQSILRPQSLEALLGQAPQRKSELEDAIWMIWSFCNVFGKTSMSDATLHKQTQWLNGNIKSQSRTSLSIGLTRAGCSTQQLEDMSEIWRCLESLLSGFKGREAEARQAGVFDKAGECKSTDREMLNAWIHDILSLGPKAVLTLSSCDFEQAKVLGITRWTPPAKGKNRANFLKAAVEEVYRDRLMKEARQKALDYRKSIQHSHKRSWSDPAQTLPVAASRPIAATRKPLRVETAKAHRQSMPLQNSQPLVALDIRPDCDPLSPFSGTPVLSPSSNPTVFSPLSMAKNASTKLGPTLFPMQNRDQSQRFSIAMVSEIQEQMEADRVSISDIIDPTDKAVALMVQEMGFSEAEAKRALAMSDTGSGINVQRAVELLTADPETTLPTREFRVCELPAAVGNAKLARKSSKREICEGHCKPLLLVEPRRERVSGLGIVKRGLSSRISFRKSARLSVILDDDEAGQDSLPGSSHSKTTNGKNRESTLSHLATSTLSTFTAPIMPQSASSTVLNNKEILTSQGPSPVSPVTPTMEDWLKPDTNPVAISKAYPDMGNPYSIGPAKPRITLQRVGTGVKKTAWSIPGRKRKEHISQPEIIGYAY